ncbi:MAG TPA: SDR family NAD(P)-dependent oxidoreductase [Gemmatimonadaceae bacterium]|nr:SDR family NAD(P)-dependent oxidoreductase [Gemmatimonadaceae bacterium]
MGQTDRDLAHKTAVVTGASSGIGQAIASRLAELGAEVCLVARRADLLEEVASQIRGRGGRAFAHPADLTRDEELRELVQGVEARFDHLDILVLSSGAILHGTLERSSVTDLDQQFRSNVRAPYSLVQALLPQLQHAQGQVVFINSSAGLKLPAPGSGQFALTQYAFRAFADALREEVNPAGIRVMSIFPGRTATSRTADLFESEGRAYRPELLMQPEDVAAMVGHAVSLPRTAEVTDISMRPMLRSY